MAVSGAGAWHGGRQAAGGRQVGRLAAAGGMAGGFAAAESVVVLGSAGAWRRAASVRCKEVMAAVGMGKGKSGAAGRRRKAVARRQAAVAGKGMFSKLKGSVNGCKKATG